jgi:hypothetical protein
VAEARWAEHILKLYQHVVVRLAIAPARLVCDYDGRNNYLAGRENGAGPGGEILIRLAVG